jgi:O-methyltransferase
LDVRSTIKRLVPGAVLNRTMLACPWLYGTSWVNYETNLDAARGVPELLRQLGLAAGLDGEIIECGSSRAGSACIMARELRRLGVRKRILAVDSFQGFDREELERERSAGLTWAPDRAFTSTSLDYVRHKLDRLGLDRDIVPVAGYFSDVLPEVEGPFSFVFIDCDLSESVTYCVEILWPRLTPGGRVVIDDFDSEEFRGARQAAEALAASLDGELEASEARGRFYVLVKKGTPA